MKHLLAYSIIAVISLAVFIIFKPYSYIDNNRSQIVCDKSSAAFDIGPNYIYTFETTLDDFNDKKARKLCEYGIIRDYQDFYKTPLAKNYLFRPTYSHESSWPDALLISTATFFLGAFVFELIKKMISAKEKIKIRKLPIVIKTISVILMLALFIVFFRPEAVKLFCKKQVAKKVVNFRNAAYKNGVYSVPEEGRHINSSLLAIYERCLIEEGLTYGKN